MGIPMGNEQDTVKKLNAKKRELFIARQNGYKHMAERIEAEIALLEMGITPQTNLEMVK